MPTEAQWEYACRDVGKKSRFPLGDDEGQLSQFAWYVKNGKDAGEEYAHLVGQKAASGYGLHDMHDNV